MFITNIYKLVVRYSGSFDSDVIPRIFFNEAKARQHAKEIADEKFYDDREIDDVIIYREVPDPDLGWFRTAGMSKVE